MRLIQLNPTDDTGPVWINPEHVVQVDLKKGDDDRKPALFIHLVNGSRVAITFNSDDEATGWLLRTLKAEADAANDAAYAAEVARMQAVRQ